MPPPNQNNRATTQDFDILRKRIYKDDGTLSSEGELLINKAIEQIAKGDSEMIRYFLTNVIK